MNKKNDFEKTIKELEDKIEKLSQENMSIDDAIKLYDEGLEIYKVCEEILDNADQQIETYEK